MKKLVLLLTLILFIPKAKAETIQEWWTDNNILTPSVLYYYNITNNGYSFSELPIDYMNLVFTENYEKFIPYNENSTIGSSGTMWYLGNVPTKANYLYHATFYICASYNMSGISYKINSSTNVSDAILYEPEYSRQNYFTINPLVSRDFTATDCKAYNSIFSSDDEDSYLGIRLTSSSSKKGEVYFVGYTLEELGVYSEYLVNALETALDNSGYATASSVAQVQSSVNQVQQEISSVDSSIQNQTEQQQQNHQETMDTITNSDVDSPNDTFEEFESFLPENGVITQLITLPISLFQKILNSINGTCSQYNLGNLLGTNLILPCINVSNYIGTTIWNVIDVLFSGFFVLKISKKMIKTFNSFSSMEEGDVLD